MFDTSSMTDFYLRVIGLYFIAAGIGVNFNLSRVEQVLVDVRDNLTLRFVAGILAFAFGVVILATHDDWSALKPGFITAMGWAGVIKGLLIIALPGPVLAISDTLIRVKGLMRVWAMFVLAVGVWMVWAG